MNQYAVLHITKYKELGGIGAHIDRLHVPENANPEKVGFNENLVEYRDATLLDILGDTIDKDKTYLNHLHNVKPTQTLAQDVLKRIKEGHTVTNKSGKIETIKKNAVLALGVILTGSPERMEEIEADEKLFKKWKKDNYDFACRLFTKENIVRFTLHIDEKTAHFHCVVVPINKEGRLSARSFINGSRQLRRIQDQYADAMSSFGLERGIYAEITHDVHVKPSVYARKRNEQSKKSEPVADKITWKNVANLSTVQKEVLQEFKELHVLAADHADKARREETTHKSLIDKHQVKAFEEALEQSAGRSYDWIKTNIEMIPFLTQELGWTIDTSKGRGNFVKLKHPTYGKIYARTERLAQTGHWVFSRENGGGGTLIDLLKEEGWSPSRISSLASGEFIFSPVEATAYTPPIKKQYVEQDPIKQTQKAQAYLDTITNVIKHPLLEGRAIERETYWSLEGLKVSGQTAAFALYKDLDDAGKYRLCSTISYYKDRFGGHGKRFQLELPRGLSILKEKGLDIREATRIVLTESPVDALSYRQLVLNGEQGWKRVKIDAFGAPKEADIAKTVFISTCGNLIKNITIELEQLFKLAAQNNQLVTLALDNDAAGIHMRETLVHMLENGGCNYLIEVPTYGKDWNEILMQGPTESIEADAAVTKQIAQDQWESFKQSPYATSLLNAIGIEERTYHAFQPRVKVNEKAMVMA
ncbi:MAG: MobV family relaxase, partial [Candidatus Amoebophilus sp.]